MDETQPLLPTEAIRPLVPERDQTADKDIVTFDPEGDTENPLDWPATYKWSIVGLLAFMAFTVLVQTETPSSELNTEFFEARSPAYLLFLLQIG